MNAKHTKAAERFLENKDHAAWHNQTLWFVREKRDKVVKNVDEWEELRELANQIKAHTISDLAKYLEEFADNAKKNGIIVHWAKDAQEHNEIILGILQKHKAKKLAKSKSMLTEECHLNPFLIKNGIDVIETDLGERILQLMDQPPSHIVMPAIHLKRQEVGVLFEEKLGTETGNSDPTYLTRAARAHLRNEFLSADVGMTGVNFAVASTGDIVVCTNEGNADMGTSLPKVQISTMGIEKVIPDHESLAVFLRLLARSATGQPITSYVSHFRKPAPGNEINLVIVDNGRSDIVGNKSHVKTLYCIRCAACMNTCPVYRRTGGYSYEYFIPGPIGINLGMLKSPKKYHGDLAACSLCMSCNNVCPVKIDLGQQIYRWRQELDGLGLANASKEKLSAALNAVFVRPSLFYNAIKVGKMLKYIPRPFIYNGLNDWGKGREIPTFAKESFNTLWKKGEIKKNKKL
ncbi:iron-sulfur cluster-binding protein [Bacteroidales bacterium]|nr:iron-sulfur cluster-binding protein [Bacteroidales bacterium]